jgi:hypothetical protein
MNINKIIIREIHSFMNESIQVYHGSDRKFDEFDMNKVGSGDGKALGGWGIYFSDDENVSRRYFTNNGFVRPHEIKSGTYFDLDQIIDDGQRIIQALQKQGIDDTQIEQFQTDYLDYPDTTNKQAYDWLAYILGGEKEASLFLKSIGYTGNTFMDKWESDARNYVIFDTKSILN